MTNDDLLGVVLSLILILHKMSESQCYLFLVFHIWRVHALQSALNNGTVGIRYYLVGQGMGLNDVKKTPPKFVN